MPAVTRRPNAYKCLVSAPHLARVECSSKEHLMRTFRTLITVRTARIARGLVALGLLSAAVGAQAGGVYWSVNVDVPMVPVGRVVTAVSNAPTVIYRSAPVVVVQQPQPVYYYGQPYGQPVQEVVYTQGPQVILAQEPRRCPPPWWAGHRHHEERGDRDWDRWQGEPRVMVDPRQGRGEWHEQWRDDRRGHH
jgi:hypothetical protein